MNIYMAPLEGITGNIFRTAQYRFFGGIDKYFTPFITPNNKGILSTKVLRDILPENNEGQNLIPQILTNSVEGFNAICKALEQYGYNEFNINLGCPSGTVVSKGRGAGFLAYTDELDRFLEGIFKSDYNISVKTRIGKNEPSEFYNLLEIYNKYSMTELIIHPRTRQDMYNNKPDWNIFRYALENSKNKVCYNGDIFDIDCYDKFIKEFPKADTVMIGRGVIANPALPSEIRGMGNITKDRLYEFYNYVFCEYEKILSGDVPLLHKMKEILLYIASLFQDNKKAVKKIKKAKNINELNMAVRDMFMLNLKGK